MNNKRLNVARGGGSRVRTGPFLSRIEKTVSNDLFSETAKSGPHRNEPRCREGLYLLQRTAVEPTLRALQGAGQSGEFIFSAPQTKNSCTLNGWLAHVT